MTQRTSAESPRARASCGTCNQPTERAVDSPAKREKKKAKLRALDDALAMHHSSLTVYNNPITHMNPDAASKSHRPPR